MIEINLLPWRWRRVFALNAYTESTRRLVFWLIVAALWIAVAVVNLI